MFSVLLIGLGVGSALGESTSSIDDSDDTPSKLNEGYLKSRSAGRDMSYSSSFGSEDFDSPDIPSDFHAKWGINKTWYVKTPHPILSRRESFENYGRAPLIDSTEVDSSEISSSSKDEAVSTRPKVTVTKSTTSTTKIATTLKIQDKSTLKSFISTVLPTKSQITTKQSMALPPLPKSPSESKKTLAKLETSKTKVTPKAVSKLEEVHTNPAKSPTALPQKNSSPRQPPITHAGTTIKSSEHLITCDTTSPLQEHHSRNFMEQHEPSPPSHFDESTTHKPMPEFIPIHETEITTSHYGIHTTEESQVHHTMTTPVVTRFKTRAWGPPLPKMVPVLSLSFLVACLVFFAVHFHFAHSTHYANN